MNVYFCCCWTVIIFIKYNTQLTKEIVQRLNSLHECPMSLRLCSTRFTRLRSVSNLMMCSFISGLVTSQQKNFNSSLSNIRWLFSYMDSCISIISISPECFVFIRKRITEDTQRLFFCFGTFHVIIVKLYWWNQNKEFYNIILFHAFLPTRLWLMETFYQFFYTCCLPQASRRGRRLHGPLLISLLVGMINKLGVFCYDTWWIDQKPIPF